MQSMTGYGKAELNLKNKSFWIEIRSVNSKNFDLNLHIPADLRVLESSLRKSLPKLMVRGKVDLKMGVEKVKSHSKIKINDKIVSAYHCELKRIVDDLGIEGGVSIEQLLNLPEVFTKEDFSISKTELTKINKTIKKAIEELLDFRKTEGKALEKDILKRVDSIEKGIKKSDAFEKSRIVRIKAKLSEQLEKSGSISKIDNNRLEQELIYYLEKLDVTEEKIRLASHCSFFRETIKSSISSGKKLNFISQEIARELNTLGSKANDASIQKIVVEAKDDLEKIKEQLFNVL